MSDMMVLFVILAAVGELLAQTPKPAPPQGIPAGPGVFYMQSSGKWTKLDPAFVDHSKVK